jgi:hypothetical protein
MSKLFAICLPIVKGKEGVFKSFVSDINGKNKSSFQESRKKLGVRERTFHQVTPMGEFVVVTLEGDNPADAFAKFAAGDDDFTKRFTEKIKEIHGIDLSGPPPGPMPVMIVDSGA